MTVRCWSDANPPPTYNWYKVIKTFVGTYERERLGGDSTSGLLKLAHIDRNDTAQYICEAFNRPNRLIPYKVVKKTKEVKVTVIFGPRQTNFTVNRRNYTYREVKYRLSSYLVLLW